MNVVVRDKQGKPVTGLKAEDFTLLEEGKPQKISSFDFENLDMTPLIAGPGPASGPNQQSSTETSPAQTAKPASPMISRKDAEDALSNKRVIVLFFDLSSMSPDETQRAVDSARNYIDKKMTAADMISVISLASSLRLDQDFTADRHAFCAF